MLIKARHYSLLLAILACSACHNSNLVTIKDDAGKVAEKYAINEENLKHGPYESYINGTLIEKANYKNGKLQGARVLYHTNGAVEIEENYENDMIVGPYKTYFHTGVLAQEATYVGGMMQGIIKSYYEGGSIKEEVTMKDNEENGPFKEYHENGKLSWEGQYLNGDNEFGLLKNYDESGALIKKMMCDSLGICSTIWTLEKGEINPKKTN